ALAPAPATSAGPSVVTMPHSAQPRHGRRTRTYGTDHGMPTSGLTGITPRIDQPAGSAPAALTSTANVGALRRAGRAILERWTIAIDDLAFWTVAIVLCVNESANPTSVDRLVE